MLTVEYLVYIYICIYAHPTQKTDCIYIPGILPDEKIPSLRRHTTNNIEKNATVVSYGIPTILG